jgi:hypothetical protein
MLLGKPLGKPFEHPLGKPEWELLVYTHEKVRWEQKEFK